MTQQSDMSISKRPSNASVLLDNSDIAAEAIGDRHLVVRSTLVGEKLAPLEVFLLVITVLAEVAKWDAAALLEGYISQATAAGLYVRFKEPVPPRISPPFFEVGWLMETLAAIPEFMIKQGVFQEAIISVTVDDERVADGFLGEKEAGAGLTDVQPNVAVS